MLMKTLKETSLVDKLRSHMLHSMDKSFFKSARKEEWRYMYYKTDSLCLYLKLVQYCRQINYVVVQSLSHV